ncbi:MAG: hypothetical protein AAF657_08630, partial [Acidobacteriota bacterium]
NFDLTRRHFRYSQSDQQRLREAWEMVRAAIRRGRIGPMARAGTISARINQQLLPKPFLGEALAALAPLEAEGLFIAHSGSTIAFVFDCLRPGFELRWERATSFLVDLAPEMSWVEVGQPPSDERAISSKPPIIDSAPPP